MFEKLNSPRFGRALALPVARQTPEGREVPLIHVPGLGDQTQLPEPRLLRYCSSGRKFSRTICRIPVRPFDYIVKAGNRPAGRPLQDKGETMAQYLVAIHHPDDYAP